MEQSVVVSSSHIVRQGTFATDSSKTLRSKSGAIKKGSISLPVIDDKSVGLSPVEYKGDSVELVKKRKGASEKPPVKTDDFNQSESKKDKNSPRGTIGKSKDREQTNQENGHQSGNDTDANSEQKPIQLKTSSNKSSKQHHPVKSEVVKSDVTKTQEGKKSVKPSKADVKDSDKDIDNKKVQDSVTSKPNSRIKETNHRTSEQDSQSSSLKNETVLQDKTRTSRNNVSLEKNTSNSVEKTTSVRLSKTNKTVITTPHTDQSDIRIIGHIEAPNLSGSAPTDSENSVTSDVKSTKRDTKDSKRSSNKQTKDPSNRPTPKTGHVAGYDSEKSPGISYINEVNRENKPGIQESDNFNKTQKGAPLKKRFSKASDLSEDTSLTDVRNAESPNLVTGKNQGKTVNNTSQERTSKNSEKNGTNNNKVKESEQRDNESYTLNANNLDPLVASNGVVNKPPQSTTLTRHRDDKTDSYTRDSQANPVEPVTQKSRDLKSSSKMEPDSNQELGSERVMESYDSVYAERKTLLEAEVTYKKRITQLENEMNQFVKTVDGLRTENKTIRTTMDQLEADNRKKESHQSKNTLVIDVEKDDLKRQINLLKKEKQSLDDKLNTSYKRNDELKAANQTLDDENILLRNRIKDSESKSPKGKREKSIVGSNAASTQGVKESSESTLSKTEESLRAEISALQKAEELCKKESEELRSDKKKLEYELEKYKDAAKEDAEISKDGATTARDKMELKSHVVSLQTDNQNLNEENMKLKAECLDQVRKIHELEKAEKTDVEALKNENEALKSEMKKLQEERNGGSEGNTNKLKAENKALSEALSQKKMELDELMHALNGDRIEDEVQKIKTEKEELQKKFEESQKKAEISEKAVKELEEIKTEKDSIQQKLEVSEKKVVESDTRKEEIVELKLEKEKLQKQLDENEKRVLESAESIVMVHELKSDKERLQKELDKSKTRESKVQESLTEMKIQKDALETEKKQVKEELEEIVKTNQNLKTEMQGLESSQETMTRALDEEKAKITLLAEKECELDELREKCELLEKELARTKHLHSLEMDKINDERKKEENKSRKELENLTERKNETINKLTKKMLSMESSKDLEIKKLKEQIETLLVDQEVVEKSKATEKENKEVKLELKTLYNKYSQVVDDLEQKNTTEERSFEMSMRVEQMSVKMKLMEKDEREWRVKRERFDEIEASNKRLIEENVMLKKMLEGKGDGSDDMSHRINYLERRQTDADTRVKQLEGWVGDLYVDTERSDKGRNKKATKNKKAQNSKTMQIQNPSKLSTENVKARSLDDVEMHIDDKATESSTPTLPSIYANSTGQMTYRSVGYSQIHKTRLQNAAKKRR